MKQYSSTVLLGRNNGACLQNCCSENYLKNTLHNEKHLYGMVFKLVKPVITLKILQESQILN